MLFFFETLLLRVRLSSTSNLTGNFTVRTGRWNPPLFIYFSLLSLIFVQTSAYFTYIIRSFLGKMRFLATLRES